MSTKVSVFGQQPTETKELKKIEFVKFFSGGDVEEASMKPTNFKHLVLISKFYCSSLLDLIWAYDSDPNEGNIYLGHWNDGIV